MHTRTVSLALLGAVTAGVTTVAPAQRLERPDALRIEGDDIAKFRRVRGADPQDFYPPDAKKKQVDGSVLVDLLLNEDGQVLEAQVVREDPPNMGFGLAALDVAKTYEFTNPYRKLVLMPVVVKFLP